MSWISAARTRLHLLFARRAADSRMAEEIGFHIEMETARLVRDERVPPHEARRRAMVAFGGVTRHEEALRDGRGLAWLGGLSLDLKLGARMLRKYPGLTLVGGLAMAFAIWVGAVTFEMVSLFAFPVLPLPDGGRIVQLRNRDVAANQYQPPAPHDFIVWRQALSSVADLGAYRDVTRNLITAGGEGHAVQVAEVTASAFRVAPVRPLLGRVLTAADERAGAPPVVVLGHDVWQTRFAADPHVLGRSVRLDETYATVVGVMPRGFAFPVYHEAWTALRPEVLDQAPGEGAGVSVFGRLAPGATLEGAQAQLAALGRRAAAEFPATHQHLQPRVAPYAKAFFEPGPSDRGMVLLIYVFPVMLLVLICSNVALLLFARAAARERELVVRSALGASRGRIVMQLFAEALVLGAVAAAVGLAAAALVLRRWGLPYLEVNLGRLPFWFDPHLSAATVLYSLGLTVLAAVIAGVLPALKITRGLGSRLKEGTAGAGVRLGGVWTAVIVAQVAATVAFPAVTFVVQRELLRARAYDVGFPAGEYLSARLEMDEPAITGGDTAAAWQAWGARYGAALEALRRRLAEDPRVAGVTFVDRLPRMDHPQWTIELEGDAAAPAPAAQAAADGPLRRVSTASVDPGYFEVLETPILAGRGFHAADAAPDARVVIVDQAFVDRVLQGRNPVGRRVRFPETRKPDGNPADEPRPWYEIVGVVKELGITYVAGHEREAGLYLPAALERAGPLNVLVHVRGDPASLVPRVHQAATAADPALRLADLQRLDQVADGMLWFLRLWLRITVLLTAVTLLLSLAGIYAVLSFTVARRTREIGVRVALGASGPRLVADIFRKPLTQVSLGVVAGGALIAVVALVRPEGGLSLPQAALLVPYSALMLAVCLLACIVPTRRALRVQPTEAMRAE